MAMVDMAIAPVAPAVATPPATTAVTAAMAVATAMTYSSQIEIGHVIGMM
jgi:hypothetical protein